MRLNNKNIVVTAAAQGIGRATAIAYSKEGANVVATDINEEKLNELKAENSNITTEVLDSTNKEAVENFSQSIKDGRFISCSWICASWHYNGVFF